jgi:hypothetical protein
LQQEEFNHGLRSSCWSELWIRVLGEREREEGIRGRDREKEGREERKEGEFVCSLSFS